MAGSLSPALVESLSPEVREALASILDRFVTLTDLTEQLAKAVSALDELDTRRADQIQELRLTLRLLLMEKGIETTGEPLVDLIRRYAPDSERLPEAQGDYCRSCNEWIPAGEIALSDGEPFHRTCYQARLRELRAERERIEGDRG